MIPWTPRTAPAVVKALSLAERRTGPDPMQSDPIEMEPRILPRAGLEWLSNNGYINPSDESPFAFLRQEAGRTSRAQRTRAAASLFGAGDLICRRRGGGRSAVQAGGGLERSLAILERPQARLRFGICEAGQLPTIREFFLCGDHLVFSFSDGDTAFVGEPVRLDDIVASLVRHLSSPDLPAEMEMICMMPQLYELVVALWKDRGKSLDSALSKSEVAALLQPRDRRAAAELLASMTEAGVLQPGDCGHTLRPAYQQWLRLAWSDCVFEIERGEPEAGGWGQRGKDHLLLVGPPGQRVLCEEVALDSGLNSGATPYSGGARDKISSGQEGLGVMLLSRLDSGELMRRLAALLRPVPVRPGACSARKLGRPAADSRLDIN